MIESTYCEKTPKTITMKMVWYFQTGVQILGRKKYKKLVEKFDLI